MAPALSEPDRDPAYLVDAAKMDPHEVERLLGELGASAGADLLRAIKTLEPEPEHEQDPDAMYPLVAELLELPADDVPMDSVEEQTLRCSAAQVRLERRIETLRRRLRLQQARATGRHASEEASAAFWRALRTRPPTRAGVRALVDRLRAAVVLPRKSQESQPQTQTQTQSQLQQQTQPLEVCPSAAGLSAAAGALRTHLTLVERRLDSDATESSSGAESDDEPLVYNNPYQNHMPL